MIRPLWPHQIQALASLKGSLLAGHRRPMLQAPTGAGKTLLATAIVDGALRKGNRVIFVVPALSLIQQTVNAFAAEGIDQVGVMQGYHELTDWTQPIQVASVQTLQRRRIPEADVVVIDEAHRWFKFYARWMADPAWASVPFIGLSASPWTRGLGKFYDDLITVATTRELIEAGYLSPFRVFAPSHPDLSGVRTVAGDYHEGDLSEAMDKAPLVADVVDTWLARGEGRPTLCFGVDRAHAKHLETKFRAAGVSTGYIDAYTESAERERIGAAFNAGKIQVVCNVGCLTTGVDWDVRCIVLARPTKSEMLFVQIIGRGLRTAEGKADCLILDHSDTTLRLGFVTDIHHDTLDDGKERLTKPREKAAPLPKECPSCTFLKPPKVHVCPACGFKPSPQSCVEVEDGELREITGGAKKAASREEKQLWYSMLLHIAGERRYAIGWVGQKYRERFEVWPRDMAMIPTPPNQTVERWVKSRSIAWAKRKDGAGGQHARAS